MNNIIPPKGGSGTAPPKGSTTMATVDAAELARLRAIERAALVWRNTEYASAKEDDAASRLIDVIDGPLDLDNPPAPLPADEQISRLLQENELLASRMLESNKEVASAHGQLSAIRSALDRLSSLTVPAFLKARLAAK